MRAHKAWHGSSLGCRLTGLRPGRAQCKRMHAGTAWLANAAFFGCWLTRTRMGPAHVSVFLCRMHTPSRHMHMPSPRGTGAASHLRPSHHHSCLTKGTLKHTELAMPCTAPLSALGSRGELEAKTMGMPRGSAEWGCMEKLREVQLIPEVLGSIMLRCEMHAMIERTQDMHG